MMTFKSMADMHGKMLDALQQTDIYIRKDARSG